METRTATSSSTENVTAAAQPAETLDTRGMEPPAPILAILKKLGELPHGSTIEVRLDNLPMQLYDLIQQRGYFLVGQKQADGSFQGLVRPRNVAPAH